MINLRLKNVKNASNIIKGSEYIILNPNDYKGKWNKLFENQNPINIEIGMGKGDFIIEMAKKNPNVNFIGIEMFDSVMVRAVQKLENQNLDNLKLIRMDATYINDVFDREIDTIYLNFSDPWPKKRHEKRRLTSHEFLKRYDLIFKGSKNIIQKTDNIGLFAFSIQSLSTFGYVLNFVTLDLHQTKPEDNVMTEYEKKFVSNGVKICMLKATKKSLNKG